MMFEHGRSAIENVQLEIETELLLQHKITITIIQ